MERKVALANLVRELAQNTRVIGESGKNVSGLEIDSRRVRPGDLFIALRGERTDGHRFAADAAARGASVIVGEEVIDVPTGVTLVVVPDSARAASQLAHMFYGRPSSAMRVAGVTGTNGKTTVTHMLAAILDEANIPCAVLGTIGARFSGHQLALENTTPLAPQLHHVFAQLHEWGAAAVAMEVSSHALALQRVADVQFHAAALTNVTRDHLDFHKSFDAYAAAKRRLFDLAPRCALNADDQTGARWAGELRRSKEVTTYALAAGADLTAHDLDTRPSGSAFSIGNQRFTLHLPGRFNVSNALCAVAVARMYGISDADAAAGLAKVERVPGRMDHLEEAGISVVVDYAHTPDALENVLRTLREVSPRRILSVFGCGGDRDRGKRPQMGAVSARYADLTYVTSDNPRGEEPQRIIDEILEGIGGAPHYAIADRREAIDAAVAAAQPGDVVLVAGKGHEAYQIVGDRTLPFDDLAVAREALAARKAPAP